MSACNSTRACCPADATRKLPSPNTSSRSCNRKKRCAQTKGLRAAGRSAAGTAIHSEPVRAYQAEKIPDHHQPLCRFPGAEPQCPCRLSPATAHCPTCHPVESAEAPKQEHQVVFLQNFFDELRRRVPAGK